jgi:hypothetical protein
MITESQFTSLIAQSEGELVDFKATGYDLTKEHFQFSLVKDVLSMANTPRDEDSFIVLGVKASANGGRDLWGIDAHPDDADLQSQFVERVYPVPSFSYEQVRLADKSFGILRIPPVRSGPSIPIRDYGDVLRRMQVYFRRGSKNDVASPEDMVKILGWFRGPIFSHSTYDQHPAWDNFIEAVYALDPARDFVLVTSRIEPDPTIDVTPIGLIPWASAFDFDPRSDNAGLLAKVSRVLAERRSIHLVTNKDRPTYTSRAGAYWHFPRGLEGRGALEDGKWRDWQKQSAIVLNQHLAGIAGASSPRAITFVVLWPDLELIKHLRTLLEASLATFSERLNIVIVSGDAQPFSDLADDVGATLVQMPLHHLCSGLKLTLAAAEGQSGANSIPTNSNVPLVLAARDQRWLEEEFDIVTLEAGNHPPENRVVSQEFLRGNEISWYELGIHSDVERDLLHKLEKQIRSDLTSRRTSRINLYHSPGAGGTTVARRIVWDFHREYPSVVLRSTEPQQTAERINFLATGSGQSVLLIVDGAGIAERVADELFSQLRSRHIPAVILQILRRFSPTTDGQRSFFLTDGLSSAESYRFRDVYAKEAPASSRELDRLAASTAGRYRSAFYFALVTFGDKFLGLDPYVKARIAALTEVQATILVFLAIAHHYGQQSLPAEAFAELLHVPRVRPVKLEAALPSPSMELVVQVEDNKWRTAHDLVALEILCQVLWPSGDRRAWKQNLSRWSSLFAEFCRGTDPIPSEQMLEVVRRCFLFRENSELLGTERAGQRSFAQLIEDIPSKEGSLELLKKLTDLYPYEAHFWAHLGRFHSLERQDYAASVECIDRALALSDRDHVLHHMRGMALRQQVYDGISEQTPISELVPLARSASESFSEARLLSPDDEHAYISETQMIIRLVEYASRGSADVATYLSGSGVDPYVRESFERSEDLLERVRRNREGDGASQFEESCRAQLDRLYGRHDRALQVWDNLLSRNDVYAPPIRRQLVWTYLARHDRSWYKLQEREVKKIVDLLERNLREEPNVDSNLRLWAQAIRHSATPPSFEAVLEQVGYWRANANTLESIFYSYVFYALQAIEGSTVAVDPALRFIDEARNRTRFHRHRTKSLEWIGAGTGIRQLVHHSQLGAWSKAKEFWENSSLLKRVVGRISRIDAPQAGEIELAGGLHAFFVPARGNYARGRSENLAVSFFLGFSYEGLRAWEVRDVDATR